MLLCCKLYYSNQDVSHDIIGKREQVLLRTCRWDTPPSVHNYSPFRNIVISLGRVKGSCVHEVENVRVMD